MRVVTLLITLFLSLNVLANEVTRVRIAKPVYSSDSYIGVIVDPEYSVDYAPIFKGIALAELKDVEDNGVFGAPIDFVIHAGGKYYLMTMNNVHGYFSLYRAKKTKKNRYYVPDEYDKYSKVVYLPELYDKLKEAGVNILDVEELGRVIKSPEAERKQFWKQYRKASHSPQ